MGGRGASYFKQRTQIVESKMRHKFKLITDEDKNDPETTRTNYSLFVDLKNNKISTRASTDSSTLEQLNPHQEQILNLARKYNNIFHYSTDANEMLLKSANTNAFGYFYEALDKNYKGTPVVVLSNFSIKDKDYIKYKKGSIEEGTSVKVDEDKIKIYTTTHEFGHVIENCIMRKLLNKIDNNPINLGRNKDNLATKIKNEVTNICKTKYKDDNIYLGTYAEEGDEFGYEWFAETFTNLELSSNPAPIARALGDYLKEVK